MGLIDYIEAKQKERARKEALDVAKNVGLGLIVGAALGASAGILFAPQSGEDTRKDIQDKAIDSKETLEAKSKEVCKEIKDRYKEFAERNLTDIGVVEDEVLEIPIGDDKEEE